MVSSPRTTARPTSSSTTPPLRSTASVPFRRTSGLSTPLGAARRARRRKKCTRCNTPRHSKCGAVLGRTAPHCYLRGANSLASPCGLGHRAGDGDEAAVGQVRPRLLGGVPGQLDAAQALVKAVAIAREVVDGIAAVEVGHVVHRVGALAR